VHCSVLRFQVVYPECMDCHELHGTTLSMRPVSTPPPRWCLSGSQGRLRGQATDSELRLFSVDGRLKAWNSVGALF